MQILLTDCFIQIDGTEFSGNNTNVALSLEAAAVEVTAMGDDTRKNVGGLKSWALSAEFNADESLTGEFFDMVGQVVPIEVRPTSGAVSPTNPAYKGNALVTDYAPISGAVGDAHKVSLTMASAGPLTRATAAA